MLYTLGFVLRVVAMGGWLLCMLSLGVWDFGGAGLALGCLHGGANASVLEALHDAPNA